MKPSEFFFDSDVQNVLLQKDYSPKPFEGAL